MAAFVQESLRDADLFDTDPVRRVIWRFCVKPEYPPGYDGAFQLQPPRFDIRRFLHQLRRSNPANERLISRLRD